MNRLQSSEVATLAIALVAVALLVQIVRERKPSGLGWHLSGAALVLAAYVFTIVEGFLWEPFFNFLEHLSLALAGLVFLFATRASARGRGAGGAAGAERDGTRRLP